MADKESRDLRQAFAGLAGSAMGMEWVLGSLRYPQRLALAELAVGETMEFLNRFFDKETVPVTILRNVVSDAAQLIMSGRIIIESDEELPRAKNAPRVPSAEVTLTTSGEKIVLKVPAGWLDEALAVGDLARQAEALASMIYAVTVAEHLANREKYVQKLYDALAMGAPAFGCFSIIPVTARGRAEMEAKQLSHQRETQSWELARMVLKAAAEQGRYVPRGEPFRSWLNGSPPR